MIVRFSSAEPDASLLHPKVYSDIDEFMGYYERVATRQLADEFYAELRHCLQQAAERPELFAVRERDVRRVNLQALSLPFLVSYCWRYRSMGRYRRRFHTSFFCRTVIGETR